MVAVGTHQCMTCFLRGLKQLPHPAQFDFQEDTVGLTGVRLEPRAVDQSRPSVLLINATQLAKWPVWLQDLFLPH